MAAHGAGVAPLGTPLGGRSAAERQGGTGVVGGGVAGAHGERGAPPAADDARGGGWAADGDEEKGAAGHERMSAHQRNSLMRRGPAGPSAVLSAAISHAISDSSARTTTTVPATPWSRSMLLRSFLVRQLNWSSVLAQRAIAR